MVSSETINPNSQSNVRMRVSPNSDQIDEFKRKVRKRAVRVQKKLEASASNKRPVVHKTSDMSFVLTDSARNFDKRNPKKYKPRSPSPDVEIILRLAYLLEKVGCEDTLFERMHEYGVDRIEDFTILTQEDFEVLDINKRLQSKLILVLMLERIGFMESHFDWLTAFGVESIRDFSMLGKRDYDIMKLPSHDRYLILLEVEKMTLL